LELGGVPLHLFRLAKAMRGRGFCVAGVASLKAEGPVGRMLQDAGFTVYACHGRGPWDFRVLNRLRRLIEAARPDVLHTLLFHANVAGRRAARRARFPAGRILCEIQTVEVERRWHLLVDRLTHRGCRFTIGNSPSVIEHLARHARIPAERLRLVRGGIDPEPFQSASSLDRGALGLESSEKMVLWVGRLDPVKGLSSLLDAFVRVGEVANARLVLAGDGPERAALERRRSHLGLGRRVILLGSRRDIPALLKSADVFAFPSRTEGLPNALLEAMAAGRPIVTTDVPGCRDLIDGERNGLRVPYGDSSALAAALLRLLNDSALADRLGAEAARTVHEQWHSRSMHDAYASLYNEVGDQSASRK
jgi:glycosyltransferase involved in cell wall biosynthesis